MSTTGSPAVQRDIEASAGLDPSLEMVPMLPQQRVQMDLEAMTMQLSSLVRAIEQIAAQNARSPHPAVALIGPPRSPVPPQPETAVSHVPINSEQS